MNVQDQVDLKFKIVCRTCGCDKVSVNFYAGFIHEYGGDTGHLFFTCLGCGIEREVCDQ